MAIAGSSLLISCPSKNAYRNLIQQKRIALPQLIDYFDRKKINIDCITIAVGTRKTNFPLNRCMNTSIIIPSFRGTTQRDIITECLSYEGACGIVRMSDHKGLFSNSQIVLSSNAHPNDWVGKKMSDFWIESELNEYLQRLTKDGELRNYSYVAKMMTGENARLTVDARLVVWNGEIARIVKTISRELLA